MTYNIICADTENYTTNGNFYIGIVTLYVNDPIVNSETKIDAAALMKRCGMKIVMNRDCGTLIRPLEKAIMKLVPPDTKVINKWKDFPLNMTCLAIIEGTGGRTLAYGISQGGKYYGWLNIEHDDPCQDIMDILMEFLPPEHDLRRPVGERMPPRIGKKYYPY